MRLPERLRLEDFPHSPYARELKQGVSRLRFARRLEELYRRTHLMRMRLRIRAWISLVAALGLLNLVSWLRHGRTLQIASLPTAITAVVALLLAGVSWSRHYGRIYLPLAQLLTPIAIACEAVVVAHDIRAGHGEQLAVLAMNIVALFFFTGLMFRAALVSSVALLAAFIGSFLVAGESHALLPHLAIVLVTLLLCIVGYRDIEYAQRRNFLETSVIAELVARDELSGLASRPAFDEHLAQLWSQAERSASPLAVLMVDVDQFKNYNDTHGHLAGDGALRAVAQLLKSTARRPLDLAARYGGDEFIAVLYDLPSERVYEIAERLRQGVEDTARSGELRHKAPLSVSIGCALIVPSAERSPQGAVQLADEALYEAKQAGRNRVILKGMEEYRRLDTGSFRASATAPA